MNPNKSTVWFIKNVKSGEEFYLNEGNFVIGRKYESNDLNITLNDIERERWISKRHCNLNLHNDHVKITNIVSLLF